MKPSPSVLLTALSLLCFAACSLNSKPSQSEIKQAVETELSTTFPVSWTGTIGGGENAKVNSVEVTEWGTFNDQGKYWPAKVRVVGSAAIVNPFAPGKRIDFDKVAEFTFRKDDYGKWAANLSGGKFQ